MSIQEAYDEILEDTICPICKTQGMLPNGGFDWVCPTCGYEGSVIEDEDDIDE